MASAATAYARGLICEPWATGSDRRPPPRDPTRRCDEMNARSTAALDNDARRPTSLGWVYRQPGAAHAMTRGASKFRSFNDNTSTPMPLEPCRLRLPCKFATSSRLRAAIAPSLRQASTSRRSDIFSLLVLLGLRQDNAAANLVRFLRPDLRAVCSTARTSAVPAPYYCRSTMCFQSTRCSRPDVWDTSRSGLKRRQTAGRASWPNASTRLLKLVQLGHSRSASSPALGRAARRLALARHLAKSRSCCCSRRWARSTNAARETQSSWQQHRRVCVDCVRSRTT